MKAELTSPIEWDEKEDGGSWRGYVSGRYNDRMAYAVEHSFWIGSDEPEFYRLTMFGTDLQMDFPTVDRAFEAAGVIEINRQLSEAHTAELAAESKKLNRKLKAVSTRLSEDE